MTSNGSRKRRGNHSTLQHMCELDIDAEIRCHRRTGVVCTIGPSCDSVDSIKQLIESGMNIARIIMAHADYRKHLTTVQKIREAEALVNRLLPIQVAIAIDISGPGARIGELKPEYKGRLKVQAGDKVRLTTESIYRNSCGESHLFINSSEFVSRTSVNERIFIDQGPLCLQVENKGNNFLDCVVHTSGEFHSCDGCHVPGTLPGKAHLTEKDEQDIAFALHFGVDIIFVSWVWCSKIIQYVRRELGTQADDLQVIAKIENAEGVRRYMDILKVSDGTLIGRGHLGIDIAPEKVFLAQKMMIGQSNKAGKPIICTSQLLHSMVNNPRPTRAEAGDVANAILDGADCVMLSEETAIGNHPVKAVDTLVAICQTAEAAIAAETLCRDIRSVALIPCDPAHTVAVTLVEAVIRSGASAILLVTTDGRSAELVAQFRPPCHIIAITQVPRVARALHLHRSVLPVLFEGDVSDEWHEDSDNRFHLGLQVAAAHDIIKTGDTVVTVTGTLAGREFSNAIRVVTVPDIHRLQPITNSKYPTTDAGSCQIKLGDGDDGNTRCVFE